MGLQHPNGRLPPDINSDSILDINSLGIAMIMLMQLYRDSQNTLNKPSSFKMNETHEHIFLE